jgi:excisionase family DNA binding protein
MKDLANHMKLSPSTVYRPIRARQLPAFKVGYDWRFNVEELERCRIKRQIKPESMPAN